MAVETAEKMNGHMNGHDHANGNMNGHGHASGYRKYSWEEIRQHADKSSRWLVIDRMVYDVTNWSKKHPGGSVVLGHFGGQDATEAFYAFHRSSLSHSKKFLKPLLIGELAEMEEQEDLALKEDFRELQNTVERMRLYDSSLVFFGLHLLHIIALDLASYLVLSNFGTGWIPWMVSAMLFATSQVQLGWYQHDAGHLSIFKKSSWNRLYHAFLFCCLKGVSAKWWNHMHYQHHSKPNVIDKDPDIRLDILFVLGDQMPVEKAKAEPNTTVPYNRQHNYFFFIMPPLLFPIYFQLMSLRHIITRKLWMEFLLTSLFYTRLYLMHGAMLGFIGLLFYYEVTRLIESHWFTWVSQSNHIPMNVEKDVPQGKAWFRSQLISTCNVEQSPFNDWFTGHLNFQIEHHLFPQMPRHNYHRIAPLVKSLCNKHGIEYKVKSMYGAFRDIVVSLHKSGQLWLHTYEEFHST